MHQLPTITRFYIGVDQLSPIPENELPHFIRHFSRRALDEVGSLTITIVRTAPNAPVQTTRPDEDNQAQLLTTMLKEEVSLWQQIQCKTEQSNGSGL